jgi:2-methylcitrate dehydratase PrpD
MIDAQFSLPYAVAMIINKEIPSLLWYEKNKLSNLAIKNIAQKVSLMPDLEIERLRVEKNILSPRVKILMSDGGEYENNQKYAKGHPCKPFSLEDFKEKFKNNLSPIMKQNRIGEIIEATLKLDEFTSISDFIKLLSI